MSADTIAEITWLFSCRWNAGSDEAGVTSLHTLGPAVTNERSPIETRRAELTSSLKTTTTDHIYVAATGCSLVVRQISRRSVVESSIDELTSLRSPQSVKRL